MSSDLFTRCQGDHAAFLADGAVVVIDDSIVLEQPRLVGERLIPRLGWLDQVRAVPLGPVYEIARDGEGVEGLGLPDVAEIEHDPQVARARAAEVHPYDF